jgi:hypothetical protein
MIADLPISLVAYFLAWHYSLLSAMWIFGGHCLVILLEQKVAENLLTW